MSEMIMKVRTDSRGGWRIEIPASDLPPESEVEIRVSASEPAARYNLKSTCIEVPETPIVWHEDPVEYRRRLRSEWAN